MSRKPDWNEYVRKNLALPELTREREEQIREDLARQFEQACADARARGATDEEAEAAARAHVPDWDSFISDVYRSERRNAKPRLDKWQEQGVRAETGGVMSRWLNDLRQDALYGLRTLRKNPGFTIVAVLTLALGIGANTAIFSMVNGVLLRPLSYADPDKLVAVWETFQKRGSDRFPFSFPNFRDWQERNQVFEKFALFRDLQVNFTTDEGTERLPAALVTAEFLPALRVSPQLGRAFTPADDVKGAEPVALLSHEFWQHRFGGDPAIVGQRLTINGAGATVIGVLPAGFEFPIDLGNAKIWTPAASDAGLFPQRGLHGYTGLARLKPSVTMRQAQVEMSRIAAELEQEYPRSNEGKGANIISLQEQVVGESRLGLLLLLGVTGFVLLIACANVANLLMARSAARQREFAIRTALGAGRGRLIRLLLTESSLLVLGGGTLGTILAPGVVQGIRALLATWEVPRLGEVSADGSVLAFAIAVSLMSAVLFGLAPALQSPQLALYSSLKEGLSYSSSRSRRRVRGALVILEVAMAIVLLLGAGLLLRSFLSLLQVNPGFNTDSVLTFRLIASRQKYDTFDQVADFHRQVETHIAALPGVLSSGASDRAPLAGGRFSTDFWILGRMNPDTEEGILFRYYSATPGYFRTLGIPLLRGRLFTEEDRRHRPGVVLINQTMAQRYWPDGNPLGDSLMLGLSFGQDGEPETFEVVGVVGDVKQTSLDAEVGPQIYIPYRQQTGNRMYFVVRTEGDPLALADAIRAEVAALDRDVPLYEVSTMEALKARSTASRRVGVLLLGGFAVLALALAVVGLYGAISYSVSQRTHEMGIRMALGAGRGEILKMVLREGLWLALTGLALGTAGAFALTRLLEGMLYGVAATDPATFLAVSALLLSVALAACYLPARRATKVDPMVALRYE